MKTDFQTIARLIRTIRGLPNETPVPEITGKDTDALSRDIATSFSEKVQRHTKAEIEGWLFFEKKDPKWEEIVQRVADQSLDSTSFCDLERLARDDPERALERWEHVKAAARADLASGWQAGRSLRSGIFRDAWEQACYLAVREQFESRWPPRDGVESMALDEIVQYETYRRKLMAELWKDNLDDNSKQAPKLTQAIDRVQRLFEFALQRYLVLRRSPMPAVVARDRDEALEADLVLR